MVLKNMGQRYYETDDEDLFFRIKTIINNGGKIVQVVSLKGNHIIIYTNK